MPSRPIILRACAHSLKACSRHTVAVILVVVLTVTLGETKQNAVSATEDRWVWCTIASLETCKQCVPMILYHLLVILTHTHLSALRMGRSKGVRRRIHVCSTERERGCLGLHLEHAIESHPRPGIHTRLSVHTHLGIQLSSVHSTFALTLATRPCFE